MRRVLLCTVPLLAAAAAVGGCDRRKSGAEMPPADNWQGSLTPGQGAPAPSDDPHAGVMDRRAGAGDPHAGVDMSGAGGAGGDPHAGMAMPGGAGGDPHAGVDMSGGDMHATDTPPDPASSVSGAVVVAPAVKANVKPGGVLFMSVRPAGPDGQPAGMPVAVEIYRPTAWPVDFTLSGGNQMVAGGGAVAGDVVVMARWDQDGDAGTKQPGDITGMTRARVPAQGLSITLDTVLP